MDPQFAIWIAIASGAFALLGSLGSQAISAIAGLRTKRLELAYARKADAYNHLMQTAGAFAHDAFNEEKYVLFLNAYLAAKIICSDEVLRVLEGPEGLNANAQRLRTAQAAQNPLLEKYNIAATTWNAAMEKVSVVMRADLQRLSKH